MLTRVSSPKQTRTVDGSSVHIHAMSADSMNPSGVRVTSTSCIHEKTGMVEFTEAEARVLLAALQTHIAATDKRRASFKFICEADDRRRARRPARKSRPAPITKWDQRD